MIVSTSHGTSLPYLDEVGAIITQKENLYLKRWVFVDNSMTGPAGELNLTML